MLLKHKKVIRKRSGILLLWNKIASKLAQTHQSIGNLPAMLLEQKEVSKKRSGKLSFWNKNNIKKIRSKISINTKLTLWVV